MGFEYKIKADFTARQLQEIADILERNPYFEKKYNFQGKENRQFRHPQNTGEMANLIVIFEIDGIYVCQFATSYLWTWLEVLKTYLDSNEMTYTITDYQE